MNYLKQYLDEKKALLEDPQTFREKYPNWEEGIKIKDILQNINNHIKFWEAQK